MSMKALNDIRDMLCEELDELARKGELGAGDLEIIHKAVSSIKNIDKIEMYDSRDDAREHMRRQLQDMIRDTDDDNVREVLRRCMTQMENM